jgi:hypothetical protein
MAAGKGAWRKAQAQAPLRQSPFITNCWGREKGLLSAAEGIAGTVLRKVG